MKLTDLNRYQAFGSHLLISLLIFAVILVCITQYWYPGILFDTGNGWKAVGLIVGIDLILGPLLTLLVFNPKKSSLKFDLSVIAAVQIAALAYGTWTIYKTHPVAIAFVHTHFITLYAHSELGEKVMQVVNEKKTNQLYYDYDSVPDDQTLYPQGFKSYSESRHKVLSSNKTYFHYEKNPKTLYVRVDPYMSSTRNIILNSASGEIEGYIDGIPSLAAKRQP